MFILYLEIYILLWFYINLNEKIYECLNVNISIILLFYLVLVLIFLLRIWVGYFYNDGESRVSIYFIIFIEIIIFFDLIYKMVV